MSTRNDTARPTPASSDDSHDHQLHRMRSASIVSIHPKFGKSGKVLVEWYLSYIILHNRPILPLQMLKNTSLFTALSTMGTLGAGFTLSVVVLSPPSSENLTSHRFSPQTVKTFSAVSSILFVLTVLVSQGFSQLFRFEQACIAEGVDHNEPLILWGLAGLSLLLQIQVLGAFLFLELVLTAFEPAVGWVGVALTAGLGLVALGLWVLQATGRKPVARCVLSFLLYWMFCTDPVGGQGHDADADA